MYILLYKNKRQRPEVYRVYSGLGMTINWIVNSSNHDTTNLKWNFVYDANYIHLKKYNQTGWL